jgi:plastocyanin
MMNSKTSACLLALAFSLGAAHGADPKQDAAPTLQFESGTIEGLVTFRGEIPKSATADNAGVRRNLLQVDPTSGGLANTAVWLRPHDVKAMPRVSEKSVASALMDQRDHEFVPRVLAVRAGQPVKFSNSDPANHNVRTSSPQRTNEFNVFTGADGAYTRSFAGDDQQRPVRVGCDIHPWMRAWIYVFEYPYFAVTDERGRFRISSVPPGKYTLAVRQPDVLYVRDVSVTISKNESAKIQIEIRADDVTKPKE